MSLFDPTGDPIILHRMDEDRASVDFDRHLADAETVSTQTVTFWQRTGATWTAADSLFGAPAPAQASGIVSFWVRPVPPAASAGTYSVRVSVTTSTARVVHSTHPLSLRGAASA